jgi:hypothetical protein
VFLRAFWQSLTVFRRKPISGQDERLLLDCYEGIALAVKLILADERYLSQKIKWRCCLSGRGATYFKKLDA